MSTQAVVKKGGSALEKSEPKTLKSVIAGDYFKEQVIAITGDPEFGPRFVRACITAIGRTPKLQNCTQISVLKCMMDLASTRLLPDGRRAHLIPYKDECTLIIDYKGLVELAMRSGEIANIHADVVCENDAFKENLGQVEEHRIDRRKPRGNVYAAYCIVRYKDPAIPPKCEVMSKDEIEAIRRRSKAGGSGPWVTDWNEMAKKTVFRRASKWLPLSAEARESIEKDDAYIDIPGHSSRVGGVSAPKLFGGIGSEPEGEPAAEPEAAGAAVPDSQKEMLLALRLSMKSASVDEGDLIVAAINADLIEETMTSLDDVAEVSPSGLKRIMDSWTDLQEEINKGK